VTKFSLSEATQVEVTVGAVNRTAKLFTNNLVPAQPCTVPGKLYFKKGSAMDY
jgi:hypothetical protein